MRAVLDDDRLGREDDKVPLLGQPNPREGFSVGPDDGSRVLQPLEHVFGFEKRIEKKTEVCFFIIKPPSKNHSPSALY